MEEIRTSTVEMTIRPIQTDYKNRANRYLNNARRLSETILDYFNRIIDIKNGYIKSVS